MSKTHQRDINYVKIYKLIKKQDEANARNEWQSEIIQI